MLAAKCFGVPEDRVTDEMRQAAKSAAHIYAYSNGPSKFKKIGLVQ
jgi:DNA polymerase I-like protein with 3'-5' exonuclease and polymerase domains